MPIPQEAPPDTRNADLDSLGKGAAISLIGIVAGRVVHVLGLVFLARWLGVAAFGLYSIGLTVMRVLGLAETLGLESGVIRFAPRYSDRDPATQGSLFSRALVLSMAMGTFLSLALYATSPWLARSAFGKPELVQVFRLFALAFPLESGLAIAAAATRTSRRMQFSVYARQFGQPVANFLFLLIVFVLGWRLFGAVLAFVASVGVSLLLAGYYVQRLFPETFLVHTGSYLRTRELLAFTLPISFAGGCGMMIVWVDRLVVAHFRPASEVGIYNAASQCSFMFVLILNAFDAILSPMISFLYANCEMRRLEELFRVGTKWVLYLSLPVFLLVYADSRSILSLVFGSPYAAGASALLILTAGQMVNAGVGNVATVLVITGDQSFFLGICATAALLSTALCWVFVPAWGITGAALGAAVAVVIANLACLIRVRARLKMWPYDHRYRKAAVATLATVVALLLLRAVRIPSPVLSVSVHLLVIAVVFVGVLLLQGLDSEDRAFIEAVRSRLRPVFTAFSRNEV